ncbi:hypothetical protein J4443_03105 [Candidatus Woesearchaeota archaeon]|nr:hypothetical protein [Candidatus Woesearchaeota archaeon]
MSRDLFLYLHILVGLALILLPIMIIFQTQEKKSKWIKPLSFITALISWILLIPSGNLYVKFYPATKTLIKAGSRPWVHSIIMETKEHWGLLLPMIATVAAGLVFSNKIKESRKWWVLLMVLSILMGIMGWIITNAGVVR